MTSDERRATSDERRLGTRGGEDGLDGVAGAGEGAAGAGDGGGGAGAERGARGGVGEEARDLAGERVGVRNLEHRALPAEDLHRGLEVLRVGADERRPAERRGLDHVLAALVRRERLADEHQVRERVEREELAGRVDEEDGLTVRWSGGLVVRGRLRAAEDAEAGGFELRGDFGGALEVARDEDEARVRAGGEGVAPRAGEGDLLAGPGRAAEEDGAGAGVDAGAGEGFAGAGELVRRGRGDVELDRARDAGIFSGAGGATSNLIEPVTRVRSAGAPAARSRPRSSSDWTSSASKSRRTGPKKKRRRR